MIERIIDSFKTHSGRNAFFIKGKYYSYGQVAQKVSEIKNSFKRHVPALDPKYIGVMIYDDLESYCACIAILLSGCGYVPLNPLVPEERNREIIAQSGVKVIISSEKAIARRMDPHGMLEFIHTGDLPPSPIDLEFPICRDDDPAYVIFTSGSTGKPKGTPISRGNLNAFLDSVWHLGWKIGPDDRFLQMSSMTFDMSIITCIIPLCIGASIFTVAETEIKHLSAYKVMKNAGITVVGLVPSTLSYLEPYFDEIELPRIRYSLIGGEALPCDLLEKWKPCVPNAELVNMYGPTEITVFSHTYRIPRELPPKCHNGIVSIGQPVKNASYMIVDESCQPVRDGKKGELLLSGEQLCSGYLASPEAALIVFPIISNRRFYRTGDIVFKDQEGDIFFLGRVDQQVKVQGHRVELSELEMHARDYLNGAAVVAMPQRNAFGNIQIELILETECINREALLIYLKSRLAYYMLPVKVHTLPKFPLNQNGKIDRKVLEKMIYPVPE